MKFILISIIFLSAACNFGPKAGTPPEQVFCTLEAKQCPDGSYVGRSGPKCEFAACPGAGGNSASPTPPQTNTTPPSDGSESPQDPVFCTQEAKLCPDGSYVGRTGPKCEFAPCPSKSPEVMY